MAAASSMSKSQLEQYAANAKRRQQRERRSKEQNELAITRKAAVALTAGAIGLLKRKGITNQIPGTQVPWKIPAFVVLTGLEFWTGSKLMAAFFGGASDATLASYADRTISNPDARGWLVAGDDSNELP